MPTFSPADVVHPVRDEFQVLSAHLRWRRRQFLPQAAPDCYFGVFDSFKAAHAWLHHPPSEFDQGAAAAEPADARSKRAFYYDFSLIWWLARALEHGASSVLDIGGSVDVRRYAMKRNIDAPDTLRWRVVEVPSMLPDKSLAAQNGAANLNFSENLHESFGTASEDIWISADAIHCSEDARPDQLLKKCVRRPQHILLNGLPLYKGEDFVTIQKIGEEAFAPVHVYDRAAFIQAIKALGYTLWDQWAAGDHAMDLRGYPERSFPSFTGLYFVDSERMFKRSKPLLS